jgi:hypothetical protein
MRWWIIPRNDWFNIYLHLWLQSDQDETLHDHMYDNVSIVLEGKYYEEFRDEKFSVRKAGDVVMRRAATPHRVHVPDKRLVVSLFVTGRRYREWGFHCPQGWIHWQNFILSDGGHRGCDHAGSGPVDPTMVLSAPTAHARPQTRVAP